MQSTTIDHTIQERLALGLGDIAVLIFDMGVHYGMGKEWTPPTSRSARDLAETVKARWHAEMRALRAWQQSQAAPGEIPDWLCEAIATHAAQSELPPQAERHVAFGPAPLPPAGTPWRQE